MRPTFLGFETQKKAITASQKALDITGNNIANVNTEGYTRQRLDLFSMVTPMNDSMYAGNSQVMLAGQGVSSPGVDQIRDPYLDKKFREINPLTAEAGVKTGVLTDLENIIDNITSQGLFDVTAKFQESLNAFSSDSADKAELAAITRQSAEQIIYMLSDYSARIDALQTQTFGEMENQISDINATLSKIADLNDLISEAYVTSGEISLTEMADYKVNERYGPNELLDARNVLLDSLSTYGDINVVEEADGTVTVDMAGVEVISGKKATQLYIEVDDVYGTAEVSFGSGEEFNAASGSLKGYLDIYNGNGPYAEGNQTGEYGIPYYESTINEFASKLAEEFNAANAIVDPDTGEVIERDLFVSSDGLRITASTIRISQEWVDDPFLAVSTFQDGELDNAHIMKLASLFEKDITFGDNADFTGSFEEYINYYSNRIAQEIDFQSGKYDSSLLLTETVMNERFAVSSVSIDEEGTNMMTYQKWFNAASRMMTTLDEALDTIINQMGLVGR